MMLIPKTQTLVDILHWRGQHQSDRLAYRFLADGDETSESLTYAELHRDAKKIAAALQQISRNGDRVLLLFPSGLDYIRAFAGCLYAGAVSVTAYPPKSRRSSNDSSWLRLRTIAADAGASVVLTTSAIKEWVQSVSLEMPELTQLHWVAIDVLEEPRTEWCPVSPSEDTLAFLQYTSGSTSTPKGVMVSHRNLMHNLGELQRGMHTHSESVLVGWLPLFHDMGLIGKMLHALYVGAPYIFFAPAAFIQKPVRWLNAISEYGGTCSGAPNFAFDLCVDKIRPEEREGLDLSSWHEAFNGAEPLRAGTVRRFIETFQPCGFRPEVFDPCYGLAEATLVVSIGYQRGLPIIQEFDSSALEQRRVQIAPQGSPRSREIVACGSVSPEQTVQIVDPETRRICSPDSIGEIWIQSKSVAEGYWNRAEETEQTFRATLAEDDAGHFLRTGDLGFLHEGQLYVSGRLKDTLILRGANHYPQDIEATVEQCHVALRPSGCAAFAVEQEGAEQLVVVQELQRTALRSDFTPMYAAIRKPIAAEHGIAAAAIVLVRPGGVNKTTSGKVQRSACRAAWQEGTLCVEGLWEQSASEIMPETVFDSLNFKAVEHGVRERIARYLCVAVEAIRPNDTFAECGLDSLAVVSLSNELQIWLKRALSPTLLYDYSTSRQLARFLASDSNEEDEAFASPAQEPIAIVGMGCRFPGGADTPEAYWKLLAQGVDTIGLAPSDRWSARSDTAEIYGGFLSAVDGFDADFFGITPREAAQLDPQQRLLLEIAWEAMEDAGVTRQRLQRQSTGVYIGAYNSDYFWTRLANPEQIDPYTSVGNAHSILANRLSYFFDLHGPSLTVDTACSSSLVAVHLACQALRQRECDTAFAGAVNLILSPLSSLVLAKTLTMATDGRCKAFDARADGIVRGEGAGIVLLKRLSDAVADGDNIVATICGSAVNQDGRTNGLTAPNGLSQQAVIRRALQSANVGAGQIGYVEAHGTGTPLGDPIELGALQAVYGQAHEQEKPCFVGSVKTNFGHLEAAAGIAGLIKAVLALQHKAIPPHLHYQTANPYLDTHTTQLAIPTQNLLWNNGEDLRYAGVSAFGFGGTNAHVILGEAPQVISPSEPVGLPLSLVPLSATTPQALGEMARNLSGFLADTEHAPKWEDIVCTLATKREHFPYRCAFVCDSVSSLAAQLNSYAERKPVTQSTTSARLAFVFSGQGAQWIGMGQELFRREPVFRQTLEECDRIYRRETGRYLLDEITDQGDKSRLHMTETAQPALCAIQIGLVTLLRHWGIVPDAVVGHSMGEVAAAYCAGVFSLEETMRLIVVRARLMEATGGQGKMAAVSLSAEAIAPDLNGTELAIAAFNGLRSVVISGDAAEIEKFADTLQAKGTRCQFLPGCYAFHSEQMESIEKPLGEYLCDLSPQETNIPFISTVTGTAISGKELDAAYWYANLRRPVQFVSALHTLLAKDIEIYVEIGAQPVLTPYVLQHLEQNAPNATALPTMRKGKEISALLNTVGTLYTRGHSIFWKSLAVSGGALVSLPRYAFQRKRHWLSDNSSLPVAEVPYAVAAADTPSQVAANGSGRNVPYAVVAANTPLSAESLFQNPVVLPSLVPAIELAKLEEFLRERVLNLLGLPPDTILDRHQSLAMVGLESLMIVELKSQIEREMNVRIPTSLLLQEPTLADVAQWLYTQQNPPSNEALVGTSHFSINALNDDEVNRLLHLLANESTG